jgi:hypothetical protein
LSGGERGNIMTDKKKTFQITTSYVIELPEEEIIQDERLIEKISDELSEDMSTKYTSSILEWHGSRIIELDPSSMNCGRCVRCGAWITDAERDDAIPVFSIGATVNGKLLCDDHLPRNHPLAFSYEYNPEE